MAVNDGKSKAETKCYGCQFHGYYRGECPYKSCMAVVSVHLGKLFTQERKAFGIPKLWLLLACSTLSVTNNEVLVSNIHNCAENETLNATTNGGSQLYTQMAELVLFPPIVYSKKLMTNILFKKMFLQFQVCTSQWIPTKTSQS